MEELAGPEEECGKLGREDRTGSEGKGWGLGSTHQGPGERQSKLSELCPVCSRVSRVGLRGRSTGQGGPGPPVSACVGLGRPLAGTVKTCTGSRACSPLVRAEPGPLVLLAPSQTVS